MILYRDHRSTLADSMKTLKTFETENDLLEYVHSKWKGIYGITAKVTIEPEEYAGDRIGWNRWHYVCVNGGVVGMCNMEEAVI